ncbi:hypothetical protein ACOME3_008036 [Neoechinorhynchus agilis]
MNSNRQSGMTLYAFKNQDYNRLRLTHDAQHLFEDPEFPATSRSMYYSQRAPSSIMWKRPYDLNKDPQFIVGDANRFDLEQGEIGNCWFIAAVSMITQNPVVFERVVPLDQTFDPENYAGIFHFRFWQFGKWYDVVVDDRLPVWPDGRLVFCRNAREPNEYWAALLEKAYAKLSWSYEGLEAGQTTDALVDMTGGIEETFSIKEVSDKEAFWETMRNALNETVVDGWGYHITSDPRVREAKLSNGLVRGHAYAITGAVTVNVNGELVRLIRCKNPWGNEVEWNGAWSDLDPRWNSIDALTKKQMGVTSQADGEFWMTYYDWCTHFDQVQFCNLSPDSFEGNEAYKLRKCPWSIITFDGAWVKGVCAGGCGQPNVAKFWTNPQYLIEIGPTPGERSQVPSTDGKYTIIVACLQKYTRQKRMQNRGRPAEEYIQLRVYKAINTASSINDEQIHFYPKDLERVATSGSYINKREVSCRLRVPAGYYVVIPSTYHPNKEGKYLIRIMTEIPSPHGRCIFGPGDGVGSMLDTVSSAPSNFFDFHDGKGDNPKFGIKQWWDALPPEERARVIKMATKTAASIGVCCWLALVRNCFGGEGNNGDYGNHERDFEA